MGLFLERARSNIFENDRAHSLIVVVVIRAIFEVFYLKRLDGSAARQKRLISVWTFGNEIGGIVKGIEFSGQVARLLASRIECLKERERYII